MRAARSGASRLIVGVAARLVQLIAGFGSTLILVNKLPAHQLGIFYMCSAVGIALALSVFSPLHFPIQRLIKDEDRENFIASCMRPVVLTALISAICVVLSLIGRLSWEIPIFFGIVFFISGEIIFAQGTNVASASRDETSYFFATLSRSVIILGGLLSLPRDSSTALNALAIYAVSGCLPFFVFLHLARRSLLLGRFELINIRNMYSFGWPFVVSQVFRQVVERGDRLLVGILFGTQVAGYYSVAVDLVRRVIQGITINARLTFIRDAVEAYDSDDNDRLQQSLRAISASVIVAGLPVAGVIAVFGPTLAAPFLGDGFPPEMLTLLHITPFAFVLEAARLYIFSLAFELTKRTKLDMIVSAVGALLQTGMILLFSKLFGILGIAVSIAVTQLSMAVLCSIMSRLVLKVQPPYGYIVTAFLSVILISTGLFLAQPFLAADSMVTSFAKSAGFGLTLLVAIGALSWHLFFRKTVRQPIQNNS